MHDCMIAMGGYFRHCLIQHAMAFHEVADLTYDDRSLIMRQSRDPRWFFISRPVTHVRC